MKNETSITQTGGGGWFWAICDGAWDLDCRTLACGFEPSEAKARAALAAAEAAIAAGEDP